MANTTRTPTSDHAEPSPGTGPLEQADAARMAQQSRSDDSPTDVNNNAALARSQALTVDIAGKAFVANADRRDKAADRQSFPPE